MQDLFIYFSCGMRDLLAAACRFLVVAYGVYFRHQGSIPGPLDWQHWSISHWTTRDVPGNSCQFGRGGLCAIVLQAGDCDTLKCIRIIQKSCQNRFLGPPASRSGQGLRICICHKLPGDIQAGGPQAILGAALVLKMLQVPFICFPWCETHHMPLF